MASKKLKTDQTKLEANQRYMDKLDQITIRIRADGSEGITKDEIRAAADRAGQSLNQYILEAVRRRMQTDE